MDEEPSLSLPEWLVLTLHCQQPLHGFAVAQLTARVALDFLDAVAPPGTAAP